MPLDDKTKFYNSTVPSPSTVGQFYKSVDPSKQDTRFVGPTYEKGLGQTNIKASDYSGYFPSGVFDQPGLEDSLSRNQSAGEQIWNGALRLVGTTGTKVMTGIGYLGGFVGYAASGFDDISIMTDNGWSAYFNGLEADIKEGTPIYKPSWVTNGGFWDNAKSLSWWMDEGVDGAAYMISSLIPGAALTKGLQLGSNVARVIGKGAKLANAVDIATITTLSTISEAATEAHGVQEQVRKDLAPLVTQGKMTKEEAEKKAATAARNDFILNGLILLGPNALEAKWFFGNATKAAERNVLRKIVDDSGNIISDVGPVTKNLIAKNMLKRAGIGVVTEGLWEENAQLAAQNMVVNAAEDKGENSVNQFFSNMADNFNTTEGQMSMFLGGLMGSIAGGVGGFRSGKAEKKSITKAQTHLTGITNSYTADLKNTIRDLYEKEIVEDGQGGTTERLKKDEQGNLILNKDKATEVFDKLQSKRDIETLKQYALLTGKRDMFETLQNITFSNMAIEHLMYGEGSLEVLNQRIDNIAKENKAEYQEIFGILGEEDSQSIDKMKEEQKAIGKVIYNTLEREKDFAGVWRTPEFKNKEELKQYDTFVQSMIGNKALADARIAFANQKLNNYKKEVDLTKNVLDKMQAELNAFIGQKEVLDNIKNILSKKELTEEEQELKDSFIRDTYFGNNITKSEVAKEIKRTEEEISELNNAIKPTRDTLNSLDEKIEELTIARNELREEYGNLTNNSLKNKIQEEWENRKKVEEQIAQERQDAEEQKAKEEEQVTNATSNAPGATTRSIEALEEELSTKENTLNTMMAFLEENDPQIEDMFNEVVALREKIAAMKTGSSAQEVSPSTTEEKPSISTSNQEINGDYDSTVSTTMTSNDILNPDKSASKTVDINHKLNNTLSVPAMDIGVNSSTYSNVVMNKQLESILVNSDKIKYFYFKNDENGNPIPANTSGVDFTYVNNPESLSTGSEVEFKLTILTAEQQANIQRSFNADKIKIEGAIKEGVKVSTTDNYGYGDITKAIGIYSNMKLIGFVQLPKMFNWTTESAKAQEIARNEIIAERKAIIAKLERGEKVTSTISEKGKGNYYSKSVKGNPNIKNQDNTIIQPEIRLMDQVEGQSVYGIYRASENGGTWTIPEFSTNANTKKTLEIMRKDLSNIGGFNGQVALMVRTANGTWSPIPVFTNKLSESFQNDLWQKLLENRDSDAKTTIAAINDIAYASIDESSSFRIFPIGTDTMIQIGGSQTYKLSDIQKYEKELRAEIKDLRTNLVSNRINNKTYQERLTENKGITTNVITVNGDYFLQPFITFESTLTESEKEKVHDIPLMETKEEIKGRLKQAGRLKETKSKINVQQNNGTSSLLFEDLKLIVNDDKKALDLYLGIRSESFKNRYGDWENRIIKEYGIKGFEFLTTPNAVAPIQHKDDFAWSDDSKGKPTINFNKAKLSRDIPFNKQKQMFIDEVINSELRIYEKEANIVAANKMREYLNLFDKVIKTNRDIKLHLIHLELYGIMHTGEIRTIADIDNDYINSLKEVERLQNVSLMKDYFGEPMIQMTSAPKGIKKFRKPGDPGYKKTDHKGLTGSAGIYLSRDVDMAEEYAHFKDDMPTNNRDIYYVFLKSKKTYYMDDPQAQALYPIKTIKTLTTKDQKELATLGYDSLVLNEEGKARLEVVVFEPDQIEIIGTYLTGMNKDFLDSMNNTKTNTQSSLIDLDQGMLETLGLNTNTYISTLDAAPSNNEIIFKGKAYIVEDNGIVRDSKNTIIKTPSIVEGVLKEEAIKKGNFIDVKGIRALAVLTNKNGVLKREIKFVSLQTNREITNKQQKEEIARNNNEIGEFVKKFC